MGLVTVVKTTSNQFIRRITNTPNGYLICGDKLTALNFQLEPVYVEEINVIDWDNIILASNNTIFALEDTLSPIINDKNITTVCSSGNIVIVGFEGGEIKIFDNRSEILSLQVHGDDISTLNIYDNIIVSGSTDGTVNLMDINELVQLKDFDSDLVDEYLSELLTFNVEVSINIAKKYFEYLFVVTDMNQFSIWNLNGEKCIDFGFIQEYSFNEWKCQSIIDVIDERVYSCMQFQEQYALGIFEILQDKLVFSSISTTTFTDIIRCVCVDENEVVCCSEDGNIVKMLIE